MSIAEKPGPTPPEVARLATQKASLDRLTLIGTFGSLTDPGALIRDRRGKVHRLMLNDRFSEGTVIAIGDDSVVLARPRGNLVLKLPQG